MYVSYIKPGMHPVIVFDPETSRFYHQVIYVEPSSSQQLSPKKHVSEKDDMLKARVLEPDQPGFYNLADNPDFVF